MLGLMMMMARSMKLENLVRTKLQLTVGTWLKGPGSIPGWANFVSSGECSGVNFGACRISLYERPGNEIVWHILIITRCYLSY